MLAVCAVCALIPTGCGRSKTPPNGEATTREEQEKADVDFEVTGGHGKSAKFSHQSGGEVRLPDEFPKDIPTYPGAKATTATVVVEAVNVSFTTADPVNKIVKFYEDAMKKQGWTRETGFNTGEASLLCFKKDKRNAMIKLNRHEKETTIAVASLGK
jgi:hypothetical protein